MSTRVKIAILCVMVAVVVGLLILDWNIPTKKPTQNNQTVVEPLGTSLNETGRGGDPLSRGGFDNVGENPTGFKSDPLKPGAVTEIDTGKSSTSPAKNDTSTPPAKTEEVIPPSKAAPVPDEEYVVKEGDSYYVIAKKVYGDGNKHAVIEKANPKFPANRLKVGAKLTIPHVEAAPVNPVKEQKPSLAAGDGSGKKTYTVESNDNYWKIAQKVYGDGNKAKKIMDANKDRVASHGTALKVGWTLKIPE